MDREEHKEMGLLLNTLVEKLHTLSDEATEEHTRLRLYEVAYLAEEFVPRLQYQFKVDFPSNEDSPYRRESELA